MSENLNSLFQYLEKEDIFIDKPEFLFQIQSHPDYPSALSINDTLNFFNISNGILKVDSTEIELLPNRFAIFLEDEKGSSNLTLIEKTENNYIKSGEKKSKISLSHLEEKWNDAVLLIEKSEEVISKKVNYSLTLLLSFSIIIIFLVILFQSKERLTLILFFIFPIFGILFSIAAHKDLFGAKSSFINNFCNISITTSCAAILGSNKWKIFNFVNLRDLSIVFYASQILSFFIFILLSNASGFFSIQIILLLLSVPVLLLSIYYQKFIEKKWCPICLAIISILLLEILYLAVLVKIPFEIKFTSILVFTLIFLTITFVWKMVKNILTKQKELSEFQLIGNRFMRNYDVFKSLLVKRDKIELPYSPFIIGNKESGTIITIITNPFCGYCKDAHEIINKLLLAHKNDIQIKLIISIDINLSTEEIKSFVRSLMEIYTKKGEVAFNESLDYWFKKKNLKTWLSKYKIDFNKKEIDATYNLQKEWCKENHFTFTPAIFINNHPFPNTYSRDYLEFFINDLIEDDI